MTTTITRPPARGRPVTVPGPLAEPGRPRRGSTERAAVLTLTAAIIFQPILHPTGPGNSSPVDLLTIAAIVMAAVWAAGSHRKLRAPYALPVALYLAAGAASGLVSLLPNTALLTLAVDVLLFAWCATVVNVLSAPRALRCALVAWSWSGIFWAVVVIAGWAGHVTFLEGLNAADGNRVMFTFGDPNYASWYWVATIFILYASRTPAARWMRIAGYGALLWALVLSESNGGMLALGVGITFLMMVRGYRRHGVAGVLATGLAIGLAVGVFFTALPLNELRQWAAASNQPLLVNSIGRSAQSSAERSLLVKESLQLYQGAGGLLGTGPASTKPLLTQWLYPYANEAHDDYLAALTERGVLGLFAFLLLVGSAISRASPVVRRPLSAPFAAAVPRAAGIVAALLAISLNSYYEEVQHFRVLWLLLGIVAVLGRDAMRNRPATGRRPARAGVRALRPVLDGPGKPRGSRNHRSPNGTPTLSRPALLNLGAQGGALAAVSVASLLVARVGGPAVVGEYALLRVLPWLFGVVLSCGLPTASAFFLAGREARDPRLRPTLSLIAVVGAGVGALVWLACVIPFRDLFFRQMPTGPLFLMAVVVVTQLWTVTAKGCCQGSGDLTGANMIIVAEELWFVGAYPAVLVTLGYHGATSVVIALVISGTLATATGLIRLQQRRFFAGWATPSPVLAKQIATFGGRGQLGNMLWLMNLRFDFILLGALAGPAVLGIYAVASKVAELMRLVPTAINYVLYPRFARLSLATATAEARRLQPRATALTLALTPVLALAAYIGLPILYGKAFAAAVLPGQIIILGLSIEGAAAVSSAFLLGRGHPGLNSIGMGVGAVITVTLDVILIPRYGALGGAITSAVTYLVTTTVLVVMARKVADAAGRTDGQPGPGQPAYAPAHRVRRHQVPGADSGLRRTVDVLVAGVAVTLMLPLLVLIAVAVRLTSRGPALYRQIRVGRSGELFTILKFRSMCSGADRAGPLVTYRSDPRVTRLGGWLRATKLDELPQLINVIRGDMTLIGPRPEVPRFIVAYREDERAVLNVRPGITGPGQIVYTNVQAGPEATEDPETYYTACELHPKLAIDLDYLRRRGLRSDIRILVQTVLLLAGQGTPATPGHPGRPTTLLGPHTSLERDRDHL